MIIQFRIIIDSICETFFHDNHSTSEYTLDIPCFSLPVSIYCDPTLEDSFFLTLGERASNIPWDGDPEKQNYLEEIGKREYEQIIKRIRVMKLLRYIALAIVLFSIAFIIGSLILLV